MSFEHFVETLDNVPPELQRNFNLIRDLDYRTKELMTKIEKCLEEYPRCMKRSERAALKTQANELFSKMFSFADDKIELACLTYDLVDKNINRLLSLQPVNEGGKVDVLMNRDMPEDPHEPVYCICRSLSRGKMVGCDNNECSIEWFHYECVGLTEAPKEEKWYCPQCLAQMQPVKPKPKKSRKRKH